MVIHQSFKALTGIFLPRDDQYNVTHCALQGKDLGRALFQDAARRVIHAAEAIGIRGLLVHALSEEAKAFNLRLGLDPSPLEPMTLMTSIADLRAALAE